MRAEAGKWYNSRMITLILGIAAAGGVFAAAYFAADVNGDGQTNNADLGVMKSLVIGSATLNQSTYALTAV